MGGGDSGGGQSTVTQVQQIPQFQQDQIMGNEDLSNSLAAQPYQLYPGTLVEGLNSTEQTGLQDASSQAYNYVPTLNQASTDPTQNAGYGAQAVGAASPANAGVVSQFMNPYVQNSLAPQLLQAGITQAQQQNQINSQATGANAFGDARQGTQNALQNYYGQQTNAGIESQGLDKAYTSALGAAQNAQTVMQNQQTLGQNQDKIFAGLAQQQQSQGLAGANAIYNAGNIQQTNTQAQDNAAYGQFQNQVNHPFQMLNVRESTVNSSPYQIANAVTQPQASALPSGLGQFAGLAGALGGLTSTTNGQSKAAGQ